MSAEFASTADMADKTVTFDSIGPDLYAFTAEGDPNSGVIVGDDGAMVVDAQATPVMARQVIERVAKLPTSRSNTSCSRTITPSACSALPLMPARKSWRRRGRAR